jgi:adenine-specific DNA-methyltransferase
LANKLILGDSIQELKNIEDNSIDLIITSPPYNAEKEYEGKHDLEQYKKFAEDWTADISRILKDTGSLWLNVGYTKTSDKTTLPLTYLYFPLIDIPFIQEIIWHYEGGMNYKHRFTHRTERWMWFAKNENDYIFNLDDIRDMSLNRTVDKRNNPLGKNPTDYWYFDRIVSGTGRVAEKRNHPCQFPEKMIERIIKACSNEGATILDPFAGSGTVGFVSKRLNRSYILIEKEEKYFKEFNEILK